MRLINTRKAIKSKKIVYIAKLIKTTLEIEEEELPDHFVTEFEKHNFVAIKLCELLQKRGKLKKITVAGAIKKRDGFVFIINPKIVKL